MGNEYTKKYDYFALKYQMDCMINICDKLETSNNGIILLHGKDNVGKNYVSSNLTLPIGYNRIHIKEKLRNTYDLLIYLNEIIANTADSPLLSISANASLVTFSILGIFKKINKLFKQSIQERESKINTLLGNSCKKMPLVLVINIDKDIDNDLYEYIYNLRMRENIIVLLIMSDEDYSYFNINNMFQFVKYNVNLKIEYTDLYKYFNKIPLAELNNLIKYFRENIGDIIRICNSSLFENCLCKNKISSLYSVMDNEVEKLKMDTNSFSIAKAMSNMSRTFTKSEIEDFYDCLSKNENMTEAFEFVLSKLIKGNIFMRKELDYDFFIELMKSSINKSKNNDVENYYSEFEKKLSYSFPLDYASRYTFLKNQNTEKADDILLLWKMQLSENSSKSFVGIEFKNSYYDEAYENINYCINNLNLISPNIILGKIEKIKTFKVNSLLHAILLYLKGLLNWKIGNVEIAQEYYSTVLKMTDEWEISILCKMSMISFYVNEADKIDDALVIARKMFFEIEGSLRSSRMNMDILMNVLYRKSNAVFDIKESENYLESSYNFFNNYKSLFENQFYMSLCNYASNQQILGNFDFVENLYKNEFGPNPVLSNDFERYNYNNYLINKYFVNKLDVKEIDTFKNLIGTQNIVGSSDIMFRMNLATLYLYCKKHEMGIAIYKELLQETDDDYYQYFIKSNLVVYYLSRKNIAKAYEYADILSCIPSLYKAYEKQFLRTRNNALLKILKSSIEIIDIDHIDEILSNEFKKKHILSHSRYFSIPFLLSSNQFWTEN